MTYSNEHVAGAHTCSCACCTYRSQMRRHQQSNAGGRKVGTAVLVPTSATAVLGRCTDSVFLLALGVVATFVGASYAAHLPGRGNVWLREVGTRHRACWHLCHGTRCCDLLDARNTEDMISMRCLQAPRCHGNLACVRIRSGQERAQIVCVNPRAGREQLPRAAKALKVSLTYTLHWTGAPQWRTTP